MGKNQGISYVAWKGLINCKNICIVVCFLLGNSSASELYIPTFRNALFHVHRQEPICLWRWNGQSVLKRRYIKLKNTYLPMKMERIECSETSTYKFQTPRNYPEESIKHLGHGESLKSRKYLHFFLLTGKSFLPIFRFVNLVSVLQGRRQCPTPHSNTVVLAVTRRCTDGFNFQILEGIFSLCQR